MWSHIQGNFSSMWRLSRRGLSILVANPVDINAIVSIGGLA